MAAAKNVSQLEKPRMYPFAPKNSSKVSRALMAEEAAKDRSQNCFYCLGKDTICFGHH